VVLLQPCIPCIGILHHLSLEGDVDSLRGTQTAHYSRADNSWRLTEPTPKGNVKQALASLEDRELTTTIAIAITAIRGGRAHVDS
jgi:hypothetical protein